MYDDKLPKFERLRGLNRDITSTSTTVNLSNNEAVNDHTINEILGDLTVLPNLQELDLGYNELTALPSSIGKLKLSPNIEAWPQRITALPESIGDLSSLQELQLGSNSLTAVPKVLATYPISKNCILTATNPQPCLKVLATYPISKDCILVATNIHGGARKYWQLIQSRKIVSCQQRITELPSSLGNLSKLHTFWLGQNNELTALPESLDNLRSLKVFAVSGHETDPVVVAWRKRRFGKM